MEKLIAGLLLLLVLALPARAQDAFTTALPGLAGGFSEAAAAVEQLGASADPRALPVLRAMAGAWRELLGAGFLGALASQFWFIGFALAPAADVRTLALAEVVFAALVSRQRRERIGPRSLAGIVLVMAGVAWLLRAFYDVAKGFVFDFPRWVLRQHYVRVLITTRGFQLLWRMLVKPIGPALLAWLALGLMGVRPDDARRLAQHEDPGV